MLLHLSLETYQLASSNMEQHSSNMLQNHMTRRRTTPAPRAIYTKFFCSSKVCFQVMSSSRELPPAVVQGSPLPSLPVPTHHSVAHFLLDAPLWLCSLLKDPSCDRLFWL